MRTLAPYPLISVLVLIITALTASPASFASDILKPVLSDAEARAAQKAFKKPAFARALPAALSGRSDKALLAKLRDWAAIQANAIDDEDISKLTQSAAQMRDFPRWSTTRRRIEARLTFTDPADVILAWFAAAKPITGKGDMLQADALIRAGVNSAEQTAQMRKGWRRAWMSFDEEDIVIGRHMARLTSDDHLVRARFLMAYEGYSAARRMLPRLDEDQRLLLQARLKLRGFSAGVDSAVTAVPAGFQDDPSLILDRAYWRRQKRKQDGAIELLTPDLNPMALVRPERLWRERHFWARRLLKEKDPDGAYTLVANHGMTPKSSSKVRAAFADAEWTAGWLALRFRDRPEQALVHFQRMYNNVTTPISRARGAYWLGRAAAAIRDSAAATQWYKRAALYPHRYYGRLAAENLDTPPLAITLDISAVAPMDADAAYAAFLGGQLPRAARLLKDAQRNDLVGTFLSHIAWSQKTPEDVYLMSRFGSALGRPDLPLRVAKKLEAEGIIYRDAGYPTIKLAKAIKPKAPLMHAIARQESVFDPTVVSRAGARGLMQLMPATAKRVAKENGLTYRYRDLTGDPAYNMALSSHYIDFLAETFDDASPLMVASYNAGENAVARWVKTYGDPRDPAIDAIDWMETIPYSETRNYVQRVLEALMLYQNKFDKTRQRRLHSILSGGDEADG